MSEFYPEIKLVHVVAVLASGLLFLLRGALVQLGRERWAAFALLSVLPPAAFANGWLAVKLLLLPAYIACGWLALRRSGAGRARMLFFLGALAIYGFMLVVAQRHDPWGPLRFLLPG